MSRARTLAGAIGSDGALNVADVAGLAAVASSGSASDLSTGTLPITRIGANAIDNTKLASGAAVANLGYTPVNKAGDTMTGGLAAASFTAAGSGGQLWMGPSGSVNYIESGNNNFTGNSDLTITGYNNNPGSTLRLNFGTTRSTYSHYIDGALCPAGEQFNGVTGTVASDAAWHTILSHLNGHHTYMISVDVSASSYHDTGIILVAGCYANGNVWNFRGGGEGYGNAVISARITGSTYDWNIELKTAASNSSPAIYYRIKEIYV